MRMMTKKIRDIPDEEKYPHRHQMGHTIPRALQEVKVTVPVEDFKGPAYGLDVDASGRVDEEAAKEWKEQLAREISERFPTDEETTVNWVSDRALLLREAEAVITGDRNNQYGPPTQDFRRTAEMATAAGFAVIGPEDEVLDIQPHHVAIFIDLVKTSRIMWDPTNRDSWLDKAGYAACGYECVVEENDCD